MSRTATIELHKDEFSFSAGHFTIFSATDREDLHGHNYYVSAAIEVILNDNGLAFDYRIYKRKILQFCEQLNLRFLLPKYSKYLTLEDTGDMWIAHFNNEKIPFLKRDVVILPITNVTIEELSYLFLQQLTEDTASLAVHGIKKITLNVFNGPGQSGGASWAEGQTLSAVQADKTLTREMGCGV
jgi:6-pyruvoyltetrahydropterin/6-carboxytetrahydropterin synthase